MIVLCSFIYLGYPSGHAYYGVVVEPTCIQFRTRALTEDL